MVGCLETDTLGSLNSSFSSGIPTPNPSQPALKHGRTPGHLLRGKSLDTLEDGQVLRAPHSQNVRVWFAVENMGPCCSVARAQCGLQQSDSSNFIAPDYSPVKTRSAMMSQTERETGHCVRESFPNMRGQHILNS